MFGDKLSILKVFSAFGLLLFLLKKDPHKLKIDRIFIYITIYYIIWIFSAWLNGDTEAFRRNNVVTPIFWYGIIPLLLSAYMINRETAKGFVNVFILVCIVEAILVFLQSFGGQTFYLQNYIGTGTVSNFQRTLNIYQVGQFLSPFGTFERRNDIGAFLLIGFSFLTSLLISKQQQSLWTKLTIALFAVAIMLSFSRASMVGIIISLVIILHFGKRYGFSRYKWSLIVSVGAAILLIIFLIPSLKLSLINRFSPETYLEKGGWLEGRLYLTKASLLAFLHNPLFGVGPLHYSSTSNIWFRMINAPMMMSGVEAHNAYTELLAEVGVIGAFFLVLVLVQIFGYLKFAISTFASRRKTYLFSISVAVMAYFIVQLVMVSIGGGLVSGFFYFSIPMGFAIGLKNLAEKEINLGENEM